MVRTSTAALALISVAVLLASSTWLSGSAVTAELARAWSLGESGVASLATSVQVGFVAGTFLYALLNLADVFNPRRVFFASALLGAALNGAFAAWADGLAVGIVLRFCTGVTLAGVYPVAMKLVASWFDRGLGWELGVMVGALTLGTASPFLFAALGSELPWRPVVGAASGAAVLGGAAILAVADGPHLRARARFEPRMLVRVFADRSFRYQAIGYFGHMWELYALWSLGSFYLAASLGEPWRPALPLLAFGIIAIGALGCAGGGLVSRRFGERTVALWALITSGALCLTSGWLFTLPPGLLIPVVFLWGVAVVTDSPQLSALAVRHCPREYTGTALTVQNGVGFAITAASIQLLPLVAGAVSWRWALLALAPGPVIGAFFLFRLKEPTA